MKAKLLLIATFLLAGCGSESIREMSSKEEVAIRFETNMSYERVYRNLLNGMKECHNWGSSQVEGQLYPETKLGEIAFRHKVRGILLGVEVRAITNSSSEVVAYGSNPVWVNAAKRDLGRIAYGATCE